MGTAGAKVTVASKLPMSIELQLCEKRQQKVKDGNQTWIEDIYSKAGQIVTIAGTAYPNAQPPAGFRDRPTMAFGAALTPGVDKAFFDEWLKQNATTPMVVNHMIFSHERTESVKAEARDHKGALSGLDALTPDNDRRMPKKLVTAPSTRGADAAEIGVE